MFSCSECLQKTAEHKFVDMQRCRLPRCGLYRMLPSTLWETPRVKFERVSSEDCRTPVRGQTVKQSTEIRSAFEFFATAHKNEIYLLPTELD